MRSSLPCTVPRRPPPRTRPLVFEGDESNVQAYKHVSRGGADGAIKNAKYVLTQHFHTPGPSTPSWSRSAAWLCPWKTAA